MELDGTLLPLLAVVAVLCYLLDGRSSELRHDAPDTIFAYRTLLLSWNRCPQLCSFSLLLPLFVLSGAGRP